MKINKTLRKKGFKKTAIPKGIPKRRKVSTGLNHPINKPKNAVRPATAMRRGRPY